MVTELCANTRRVPSVNDHVQYAHSRVYVGPNFREFKKLKITIRDYQNRTEDVRGRGAQWGQYGGWRVQHNLPRKKAEERRDRNEVFVGHIPSASTELA
jgi:hypothetical protein